MANDLSKLVVGNTTYDIKDATAARKGMYVGTCTTAANTYAKVATVDTFPVDGNGKPLEGTIVGIKFSNTNTYKTAGQYYTLNVNNTGAYRMYYNNAELATSKSIDTLVAGYKNRYIYYMFDNDHWVWLTASYETNSTYAGYSFGLGLGVQDNASASATITVTLASYTLGIGGVTSVRFLYDVPANSTMNINRKGAKSIYYKNAAIGAGVIKAGDTATFVYSSQYHLIAIDRWDDDIKAKANSADLATVATSGSYNDLTDQPTIPTAATTAPLMDGTAAVGSSSKYAKEDHVHPSDTSKVKFVRYEDADEMDADTSQPNGTIGYDANNEDFYIYEIANREWRGLPYVANLASVAISGNYNDLFNKPTIPTVDSSITGSSQTNPVQGGAIYSALQGKEDKHIILNLEEDANDNLVFTDLDGNTIAHTQVLGWLQNKSASVMIDYDGTMYEMQTGSDDFWSGIYNTGDYFAHINLQGADNPITTLEFEDKGEIYLASHNWVQNRFVPQVRKINNKPLSTDITLTASDVGASVFVVNIGSDGNDGYTCDKTNAEIYAAWQAGRNVIAINDDGFTYNLFGTPSATSANFLNFDGDDLTSLGDYHVRTSNNTQTVTRTFSSVLDDSYPCASITSAKITEWDGKADPVTIVTVSTTGAVTQALDPNKFYDFTGSPTSLTLTLTSGTGLCIYAGKFTAGTGFSNFTLPSTVKVADGAPSVEAGGTYEFSIMDNLILIAKEGS